MQPKTNHLEQETNGFDYWSSVLADARDLLEEIQELLDSLRKGQPPSFAEELRRRLINETLKEVRTGRINAGDFERLQARILDTLGAKEVRIVPKRLDKGADLVATFITANTFELKLAVQAKHWQPDPPVRKNVIDQLLRSMEAEGADLGWVAPSGSFSDEASEYAAHLRELYGRRVELVDGEFLAALIVIVDKGLKG